MIDNDDDNDDDDDGRTLVKQLSHHAMRTPIKRRRSSHSLITKASPSLCTGVLVLLATPIADASTLLLVYLRGKGEAVRVSQGFGFFLHGDKAMYDDVGGVDTDSLVG